MTIEIKYTTSLHNELYVYNNTATRFDLKEYLKGDH